VPLFRRMRFRKGASNDGENIPQPFCEWIYRQRRQQTVDICAICLSNVSLLWICVRFSHVAGGYQKRDEDLPFDQPLIGNVKGRTST